MKEQLANIRQQALAALNEATDMADLDQLRVTRAKRLLRFSDLTVEAVGREVGIPEPGYFSRVFKKVEGVAPGEYRRMW